MMNTKPFFKSETIIGTFIALIGFFIHFAVELDILPRVILGFSDSLLSFVGNMLNAGGIFYAAYGRWKSKGEKLSIK